MGELCGSRAELQPYAKSKEGEVMKSITRTQVTAMTAVFGLWLGIWESLPGEVRAQSVQAIDAPKFELDPFWPKPLPDGWVTGNVGSVCIDAQDHLFTLNIGNLMPWEQKTATGAPPVTEFDPEGNLVNSWGNRDLLPAHEPHGCFVDYENNIWIGGNQDAIVQKYSHDGSKMLLQIGTKGLFDTSDGTITGAPLNSSHTLLNRPAGIVVDPTNGEVYVADGYGNRRIVVFDREGHFVRQWGRQGTKAEVDAGVGGLFLQTVHCVVIGNDDLVYVGDRLGLRVEVFDKMGNFKRNILVESKTGRLTGSGSACWIGFSRDPTQKFMYVGACLDANIRILNRATGQALSIFGRPGSQAGEIGSAHTLAVDSKGNIIVGDNFGRRIQMWRLVR
jgi:DNA-binding beta-propeller fold protein YncE